MAEDIPQGGGSLLVAWQLKAKRVLIIGGGDVASGRVKSLLETDAQIMLVSPREGLNPQAAYYIKNTNRITYIDRAFDEKKDLEDVHMVLSAVDDVETSRRISVLCRERKIPVNVADIPPMCDFYFGSQVRRGPLQILISTNGNGPKLANIVKSRIETCLPKDIGKAIENVGTLRKKLRQRAPGVGGEVGKRRMQWMTSLCTSWDLEDLALLDDEDMTRILDEGWEADVVPKLHNRSRLQKVLELDIASGLQSIIPLSLGVLFGFAASVMFQVYRIHR